jgi:hypothetical protein
MYPGNVKIYGFLIRWIYLLDMHQVELQLVVAQSYCNYNNTLKVTLTTSYKIKTSDFFWFLFAFCLLLVNFLPKVGFGWTVWRSPPSRAELSHSLLLLCFGGSLLCERKRFCMCCLGINVTLHAMYCFFSCIHCCGNMFQQFAVQQWHLPCCQVNVLSEALPSRWADCSFQASCHNITKL